MADSNNIIDHVIEFPPMSSSPETTPSPSIPLRLSGFLAGDAVQVQGDTGELQFSLQFNFHNKTLHHHRDNEIVRDSCVQSPPSLSSYLTPTTSSAQEIQSDHNESDHNADDANVTSGESWSRGEVVTRLRSGVLSPVKYYGACGGSLSCERKKGKKVRSKEVFDKMLRRRSLPIRPCNSYAFFVMANWDVVKCSSFGEKSKRLSKKWLKLPHDIKKEFEHMALKDNERYKRQCVLLRNDPEQEITYGSPALSK